MATTQVVSREGANGLEYNIQFLSDNTNHKLNIYDPAQFVAGNDVLIATYDYATHPIYLKLEQSGSNINITHNTTTLPPDPPGEGNTYQHIRYRQIGEMTTVLGLTSLVCDNNEPLLLLGIGVDDILIEWNNSKGTTFMSMHNSNGLIIKFDGSVYHFYHSPE